MLSESKLFDTDFNKILRQRNNFETQHSGVRLPLRKGFGRPKRSTSMIFYQGRNVNNRT